jgi:colanic acid biosynthesis glycosyl transferase WcaI
MKRNSVPHIGYLVQQFLPEVGAGPARVAEMARHWQAEGADVTIITGMPNRPEGRIHPPYRGKLFVEEDWQGIRVLRSWLYASPKHGFARTIVNNASFMTTSALHALARARHLDVLIASAPPFFPHVSGAGVSRLRRIPLVLEIRDLWPDYLVGMGVLKRRVSINALFALERWLLRQASHVTVVTESFRQRVIQKGVAAERIHVISNGVDTRLYFPRQEPAPLPELARRGQQFIVGYLGNFGAGQGLTAVLEAAALLAREDTGSRFVLAGDGPDRAQVTAKAHELGIENLSIHPPISKDKTRAFYNACDVCLVPLAPFPILQETVPSKIFEVMACERPLIASLGGEGARIVRQSGAGLVTEPGDARGIADAITQLKRSSADERAAFGRHGREFVARHYSRDVLATRYLEILTRVASGATPAPTLDPLPA